MKNILILLLMITQLPSFSQFYYSGGKKVQITTDSTALLLHLKDEANLEQLHTLLKSQDSEFITLDDSLLWGGVSY